MKKDERTLVIMKPDCVVRGLVGRVLARIEELGLRIVRAQSRVILPDECSNLYAKTKAKLPKIYLAVERAMGEGISIVFIFEGENAVRKAFRLRGSTNLLWARRGTIRRDFITDEERALFRQGKNVRNRMHASKTKAEAEAEIKLFFSIKRR
ncbi:nucleoside-diphosphate kinase [Patescibacteria group bacterium]|nr:nucleoside-diphosphate kinase [Patescibacteria group bacterium]